MSARYEFIAVEKANFSVRSMCRALEVSSSGYYDWEAREPSERVRRRCDLALKVKAVHQRSKGTYGSPRVRAQLKRMGETVSEKTVASIMQEE
ncbi:MAG: transposase, partial [Sphingomonadaceae bacterium]|nr:transposase [Sphingomonadaceae bacterium]